MFTRRDFLLKAGVCAGFVGSGVPQFGCSTVLGANELAPPPTTLQAGDLLFPKPVKKRIVLFSTDPSNADWDAEQWQISKSAFLLRFKPANASDLVMFQSIERMGYSEFLEMFSGAAFEDTPMFGADTPGPVYVGHVGLVVPGAAAGNGADWDVVEAMPSGVVRTPYALWREKLGGGARVWHARFTGPDFGSNDVRAKIASSSIQFVERKTKYNLWNFDPTDDSDVYCSKLVWLCAFRATGKSLDGGAIGWRPWWITPLKVSCQKVLEFQLLPDGMPYGRC